MKVYPREKGLIVCHSDETGFHEDYLKQKFDGVKKFKVFLKYGLNNSDLIGLVVEKDD